MGVYLSQPITDKITHSDSNSSFRYTSCEMQGWRKFMEDAKITCLELNSNGKTYSVFGVFDGHGGIIDLTKELKSQHLWRKTSSRN